VHILPSLENILALIGATKRRIYFAASYRTQKVLKAHGLKVPSNVTEVDPIGYEEILALMTHSRGVITDSGTIVEETCVLQVPSIQIRKATERPQVYDVGSSVKFDPARPEGYPVDEVYRKFEALYGRTWPHTLGDGKSSQRIADDMLARLAAGTFGRHKPSDYHLDIRRSFREDGLPSA
jgi:UDP-N-acetylglucosamine 2-epimerase (non-hydrolysing)